MTEPAASYPDQLEIRYRRLGSVHVFTSPELPGLFHANRDLQALFDTLPATVSDLVRFQWNAHELYFSDRPFGAVAEAIGRPAAPVLRLRSARTCAGRA